MLPSSENLWRNEKSVVHKLTSHCWVPLLIPVLSHQSTGGGGESRTKLKYQNEKSPSQAKFFTEFVTVDKQIMNGIVNEIEVEKRRRPAAGEIFLPAFVTVTNKALME